jgi:hypothetical protein
VVEEPGTVARKEVVQHAWSSARRTLRNVSSVAGLRLAVSFPAGELIKSRERRPQALEQVFEARSRDRRSEMTDAVGFMLNSSLGPPAAEEEMDALLQRLDKP